MVAEMTATHTITKGNTKQASNLKQHQINESYAYAWPIPVKNAQSKRHKSDRRLQ